MISTVENLLSRQQALKDYFNSSLSTVKIKDGRELHPDDEKLLEDVSGLVAEHIDEEELNPAWLAERLGMSKASLYRRFKETLDKTPGEFIRSIRLEHAAKLLRTTQLTVSEIMFRCGFSNKSYFIVSFLNNMDIHLRTIGIVKMESDLSSSSGLENRRTELECFIP